MDGRVMRSGAAALLLAAVPAVAAPADRMPQAGEWRRVATPADRTRLRNWRSAWTAALADARGLDGGAIAADPVLFDPDRSMEDPVLPPGSYRCRTVKLGRQGNVGLGYVAYPWFRCMVGPEATPGFAKVDGSQRQVGTIYPDTDARAAFLGTLSLGDERGAIRYRRDPQRDVAGWVERIGERRWRIVFPYPAYESTLDIMELVPA